MSLALWVDSLSAEPQEGPEIKLPTLCGMQQHYRKKKIYIDIYTSASLTVWITANCGKFLKGWEYQTTLCLQTNLYAGEEAMVSTRHVTKD